MSQFPKAWAMGVINKMQNYYQGRFDSAFPKRGNISDAEYIDNLADIACEVLDGLQPDDIKRGLGKMKTSKFCPSFPEFRSMCEPQCKWLGANEAWNVAINSIDFNGNELTVVWTKECATAFDAVSHMVKIGDKFQIAEAKKVFVERYERAVADCIERSIQPVYVVSYGNDKEQRKEALRQAEIAGLLPASTVKPLLLEIQSPSDAKNEDMKFKTLAQEHLANIKSILKRPNQGGVAGLDGGVQPSSTPPHQEIDHIDPFDNPDEYIDMHRQDKKETPVAFKNWHQTQFGG